MASPDRSDDGYVAQYIGVNTSVNESSDGANGDINKGDDVGNLPSLPPATQTSEKIILTEEDIPGASIQEPYEKYTMHELQWWLLCRGVSVPTTLKKGDIILR